MAAVKKARQKSTGSSSNAGSRSKAKKSDPELRIKRRRSLLIVLTIPLLLSLYGFFGLQKAQTQWPEAISETLLRGSIMTHNGTVLAEGELWTAIAEDSTIDAGEEVIITRTEGLRLWVTRKSR